MSVRTIKIALILLGYNSLLALIGLFAFYVSFDANERFGTSINYSNMLTIYTAIAALEFGLVLFIVPAITSSSISGERERQTLDILLTTRLKPLQIILGKLAASISTILLLVISSLPILSIVFSIGGIQFKDLFQLMLLIIITAIYIGSIGIFFSALFKRTTIATIFTYGIVILLIGGTIAILTAAYIVADMNMANYNRSNTGIYQVADLGNGVLLLLINPAISLLALFSKQFGNQSYLMEVVSGFGQCNEVVTTYWFEVSVALQLVISVVMILWASKLLDPLKRKRTK